MQICVYFNWHSDTRNQYSCQCECTLKVSCVSSTESPLLTIFNTASFCFSNHAQRIAVNFWRNYSEYVAR